MSPESELPPPPPPALSAASGAPVKNGRRTAVIVAAVIGLLGLGTTAGLVIGGGQKPAVTIAATTVDTGPDWHPSALQNVLEAQSFSKSGLQTMIDSTQILCSLSPAEFASDMRIAQNYSTGAEGRRRYRVLFAAACPKLLAAAEAIDPELAS